MLDEEDAATGVNADPLEVDDEIVVEDVVDLEECVRTNFLGGINPELFLDITIGTPGDEVDGLDAIGLCAFLLTLVASLLIVLEVSFMVTWGP